MKKLSMKNLLIAATAVLLAACTTNKSTGNFIIADNDKGFDTTGYGLAGKEARREYNGLLGSSLKTINYLNTQESAVAQHFANFIDGLLTHNQFGVLEKNLATKVEHNLDYSEFTFTVRRDVEWQKFDGTQYKPKINGKTVAQYVKPSDWLTTAKQICTSSNGSELKYLISMFVQGADEYYYYTYIADQIKNDVKGYNFDLTDYPRVAKKLNELIETKSPAVWRASSEYGGYDSGEAKIEADDVPNIANLKRFGIIADDENYTLTYKLMQKAPYFPTLFTYSCYLPTNETFLKEIGGFNAFGTDNKHILYNGPYLLTTMDTDTLVYSANPKYWNVKNVITVDKINYSIILDTSEFDSVEARERFERGDTDGFTLSATDKEGWRNYVTGEDKSGDYQNPVDARVNSRLLDTIGSMYGSNIVLNRDQRTIKSFSSLGSADTVKNAARALRLNDVRKALLDSFDLEVAYGIRDKDVGSEELIGQNKVYTYVPKGFVIDDNGQDYVTAHYYDVYAKHKGINVGDPEKPVEGTAAYELQPGQITHTNLSDDEVYELALKAKKAVELFNAKYPSEAITFPIQIEFYSAAHLGKTGQTDDIDLLENVNRRLNGIAEGQPMEYKIFKLVTTDNVTNGNYEDVSRGGDWDLSFVQWGWGADYGDPLTFMNTYIKGGDWGDVFPYINDDYVANITTNEAGTALNEPVDLLAEYTDGVATAALETENLNRRYDLLAEMEYTLINELNIYRPQVNTGQGWSLSVSRSAGYFMPTSAYGLSSDRLIGWYILEKVMTREERQYARAKQEEAKTAYVSEHGSINIYD